ncbi:PREDICTED: proteinase inhibitor PSI-1.2-like [Lupinus angustifolius]|uniref:proteinase inhibitor PSI-1.2-like n=1 Tax=Lupinus angustifolius TaxID=3871 RepID=UPI00092F696B|nr:PREDICTED: proteinase inhibitor PSI-1.2-like [Lupinus angustifolius]
MAFNKVGFILFVILSGAIIMGGNMKSVDGKICPQICYGAAYMTCPSSCDEHLPPLCNCCIAKTGCTLYNDDGIPICTAQ